MNGQFLCHKIGQVPVLLWKTWNSLQFIMPLLWIFMIWNVAPYVKNVESATRTTFIIKISGLFWSVVLLWYSVILTERESIMLRSVNMLHFKYFICCMPYPLMVVLMIQTNTLVSLTTKPWNIRINRRVFALMYLNFSMV